MRRTRIVIGIPEWKPGKVRDYASGLARGLSTRGADASILVTEPASVPTPSGELHSDPRVETLPRSPHDDLSAIWLGLARYLEERAPCVYLSNQDWIASCVTPRLSSRVIAIGVLHDDSAGERQHCFRLGDYWNAVVAIDQRMRHRVMVEHQRLAPRLSGIHADARLEAAGDNAESPSRWEILADQYLELIAVASESAATGLFERPRGRMANPPAAAFDGAKDREVERAVSAVNTLPAWPDPPAGPPSLNEPGTNHAWRSLPRPLEEHRILLSVPTGRISGVDVFTINLARELISRGYRAEIVRTAPPDRVFDSLPLAMDVPVKGLQLRDNPTWPERWEAMREHLESRAPCIYVPNYDTRHSCIVPTLSPDVKTLGIAHSDDPDHYDHIVRLAHWWDGVVGVSGQITEFIGALAPELSELTRTIPYGVDLPCAVDASRPAGAPLRVVYAGRVTRFQKRTLDLLSVGQSLQASGAAVELTIIGDGPDTAAFIQSLPPLALTRHVRWVGSLPNDQVLKVLDDSDAFILPSSFEGLPVSLLEAMAHGCVPIVTGVRSGVPEIIDDGINGFIVPVGDIEGMAERIRRLERDEELLRRMKEAAHDTIRRRGYTTAEMTSAYIAAFERMVHAPREKVPGKRVKPPNLSSLEAHMPRLPMPVRRVIWRLRRTLRGSGAGG